MIYTLNTDQYTSLRAEQAKVQNREEEIDALEEKLEQEQE